MGAGAVVVVLVVNKEWSGFVPSQRLRLSEDDNPEGR